MNFDEIIITQGKEVLNVVLNALEVKEIVKEKVREHYMPSLKGKGQFIRSTQWKNIPIISLPHIGSQQMRTFWNSNLEQIKIVFSAI